MNRMTKPFSLILVLYLIFFQLGTIPKAEGEEENTIQNRNPASQYYLEMGTENKLMMKVNVWGAVKNPGSQYVSDETDLISLLSAAGGPSEDAKLSHVRLIRNFDGENKNLVININKCLRKNEADKIPEIKPGDTVIVPKKGHSFGRFVNILYNVAVIASVVKLMTD